MSFDLDIPQPEWDLIERYISSDLTPDEQDAFSSKLAVDPELQRKVKTVELVLLGVQQSVLTEKLQEFHSEIKRTSIGLQPRATTISMKRWLAAACVVGVVVIAAWFVFFNQPAREKMFATYYKPDAGLISAMSTSGNYQFDKAMVEYKTGEYAKAIKTWEQLLKTDPESDTLAYFLGSAYLAADNDRQALIHFDKVVTRSNSAFINEANWYKGLALIKQGKFEEAIAFIKKSEHTDKEKLLTELSAQ